MLELLPLGIDLVVSFFKESPEVAVPAAVAVVSIPALIFRYLTGKFLPKNKRSKFLGLLRRIVSVFRFLSEYSFLLLIFLEEELAEMEKKKRK